jgi:hypothetical protein
MKIRRPSAHRTRGGSFHAALASLVFAGVLLVIGSAPRCDGAREASAGSPS